MSPNRLRALAFTVAGIVVGGLLAWAIAGLPGFGRYPGPYGPLVNRLTVPARNATDAVTAVNLDFRGLDTMVEEFIMFTSVSAVVVLLRRQAQEREQSEEEEAPGRVSPARDDALRVIGVPLSAAIVVFGLYLVGHGQLSPGGGFQGGAVLVSALLLIYLVAGFEAMHRLSPTGLVEFAEGVGAGGFVVIGLAAVAVGAAFLQNVMPLGQSGLIDSAGTMPVIYTAVGLEVATGFALVLSEFLQQLNVVPSQRQSEGGGGS